MSDVTDERRSTLPHPRPPSADIPATVEDTARPSPGTPAPRPWRRAALTGLSTWAAAQAMFLLLNMMFWMLRNEAGPSITGLLEVWNRWDTGHYVTIALTGYDPTNENGAFFPLYPMTMRILEPILPGGMLAAGLIVAWLSTIAALTVIYRLADDLFGPAVAQRASLYVMAFPFAFYLCAAYNESMFLALSVASLYCMRRGHWWMAGAWAGLASATRQAGVLLALAFLIEYLRQREWKPARTNWNSFAILLVPTGLLAFMVFSAFRFDDPLWFLHIQSFWGRASSPPWEGVVGALDQITSASAGGAIFQPIVVLNVIDLLAVPVTIGLLVLAVVGPWKLGRESTYLVVFSAVSFLLVLVSPLGRDFPPLHGVPRYAVEMLPAFLVMAHIGARPHVERLYLLPAIGVQGALLIAYFSGVWLS